MILGEAVKGLFDGKGIMTQRFKTLELGDGI